MASFSLASYIIRVKNTEDQTSEMLDNFVEGSDLYDLLADYLQGLGTEASLDGASQRLIKLRPPLRGEPRILTGILETGEWGYSSELQNIRSGQVTYNRTPEESENFPFYFLISIPNGSDRGVVILQRFGNRGIRTQLLTDFQANFATTYDGLRVTINPLAPGSLIDQYTGHGRVTEVRLIQFQAPDDIADLFGSREEAAREVYTEFIIRTRSHRGRGDTVGRRSGGIPILQRLRDVFEGRREASHLVEIAGVNPNVVKISVDYNGKSRTVDIGNPNNMRAYYDITEDVVRGGDGHPEFGSIDGLARELLAELSGMLEAQG